MRKALALLLSLVASPALALNLSSIPAKFPIPWGNAAGGSFIRTIPQASQIGIQNCAASLTDGFPPLTFQPVSGGGCAPFGADFNGILKQVTQWSQWAGAGGVPVFDSSFSASISGYPRGSILVQSAQTGCYWANTVDGNTANPDSGGANWTSACPGGGVGLAPSGGSANAQTITTTPFLLTPGARIFFAAGFANTSAMTIAVNGGSAVNVFRRTPSGLAALAGGEVQGGNIWTEMVWDGSQYEINWSATNASLTAKDQTLSGGANVTVTQLTTGNVTIDCGQGPLLWIQNTNPFSITAPSNDGSCMLQIENGVGAGAVTAGAGQGWTLNGNTGEPLDTTSGHKFAMSIWRIHGVASYIIKALQ